MVSDEVSPTQSQDMNLRPRDVVFVELGGEGRLLSNRVGRVDFFTALLSHVCTLTKRAGGGRMVRESRAESLW